MDTPSSHCLLKILSGPHQGAEVLLRPGTYLVGASENCDIIISDSSFEPEHFKLLFTPPDLSIESLGNEVFLNGKKVGNEAVQIPFFQFITIGTTHMVAGPEGGGWPLITAADAPPLQLNSDEAASDSAQVPHPVASQEETSADSLADAVGFVGGESPSEGLLKPLPPPTQEPKRKFYFYTFGLLGLGVLCVGLFFFSYYSWIASSSQEQSVSLSDLKERVQHAIELQGASKELTIQLIQGNLWITGCVEKESTRISLRRAILSIDPYALCRINSEEALVDAAQIVLTELSLPIDIRATSKMGVLEAVGYAPDGSVWIRAKSHILRDVDGINTIEDHVITASDVQSMAGPLLVKQGLEGAVEFIAMPQYILVKGSLTRHQGKRWDEVLLQLRALLAQRVLVKDEVSKSNAKAVDSQYFDGEIESVCMGSFGFISLKNGQKYFVGAVLPSGYTVVSLEDQGITLKKGEQSVIFKPQHL